MQNEYLCTLMKWPKHDLAQFIIQLCASKGVKHVVISPGSRNAPLTIGFTHHNFFKCYSIVDERSAGFFALGIAQQTSEPVAVVCTSGSALLNYYPAVAEAFYSGLPLVIISADRPQHLVNIGDGQTIIQPHAFGKHILFEANLIPPVKTLFSGVLQAQHKAQQLISKALDTAQQKMGPVHINVPFDEPLYKTADQLIKIDNPSQLPVPNDIEEIREPIVNTTILTPNEYVGNVITLCTGKRGIQKDMTYFGNQVSIVFEMPLSSVIVDFFDQIKSFTKGFASIEYSLIGFFKSELTKIDILINNQKIDALSMIVHKSFSTQKAREIAANLQKLIPRQMFDVPIQVALGSKIISRETVKALRKNVTAKCYGGDITRKKKLLEKQKAGKKRMRSVGNVDIPQSAFMAVLKLND